MSASDYCVFTTESGGEYLYDTNTNTVHPLPERLSEEALNQIYAASSGSGLPCLSDNPRTEQFIKYIALWRKHTDAFHTMPAQEKNRFTGIADTRASQALSGLPCDLILVTTEQCNMRCAYCVYEENLYENRRSHQDAYMDWDTTKKAIDYYFTLNREESLKPYGQRALNVVFYGGEALLNWDVVKKGITYIREVHDGSAELHVGITTNLTLLRTDWLPFLTENKVFLNVSLDGPEEEHDRYRRFASGEPTHAVIAKNLEAIRAFDNDYYGKYVKALITFNGNTDFSKVLTYFDNPLAPRVQVASPLKDFASCGFHEKYPYDSERFHASIRCLSDIYQHDCMEGRRFMRGDALHAFSHDANTSFFNAPHSTRSEKNWFTGSCAPLRKLAVTPDGNIHICERVDVNRPVGHIDRGIDEPALLSYLNDFMTAAGDCPRCWARNRCRLCPAEVDSGAEFRFEDRCEQIKVEVKRNLSALYSLLEKKPDLFASEYAYY